MESTQPIQMESTQPIQTLQYNNILNLIDNIKYQHNNQQLCIATATLKNGFLLIGTSSKIHAEGYDEVLGEEIATKNIMDQLYKLEGYKVFCNTYLKVEDRLVK